MKIVTSPDALHVKNMLKIFPKYILEKKID